MYDSYILLLSCLLIFFLLVQTYAQVGADGSRFLLSDYLGNLFLLVLENKDNTYVSEC